jgi:hypothetical protein
LSEGAVPTIKPDHLINDGCNENGRQKSTWELCAHARRKAFPAISTSVAPLGIVG